MSYSVGVEREKIKFKFSDYPRAIPFIILSEFCERFTFFGLRAILTAYLRSLSYNENEATMIYHTFIFFNYFFALFGGILADSYIGQFNTIAILSTVFACGSTVITIGSIMMSELLTFSGLFMIAIGSGGIKTCVSSFGAEQFKLPEQQPLLNRYFAVFYFVTNIGSILSMLIIPPLKFKNVCFNRDHCYPLGFGIPAILMFISVIIFVVGKPLYKVDPPSGKVVLKSLRCIMTAVKTKRVEKDTNPRDHWLDYAEAKLGPKQVLETKMFLRILVLFIPLPIFWALFDQQGSRWTIQATKMDHDFFGYFRINSNQMQILNPVFIILLVPICDLFNPLLRCYKMYKPLRSMLLGGIFTSLSFFLTYWLQTDIDSSEKEISMLWQIPQYFFITLAEILFSVTGLAFAFTDSPVTMRNVVSACWLVTIAAGNALTTLVVSIGFKAQSYEFLVFACLMIVNMIVFIVLAYGYQHVTVTELVD